MNEHPVGLPQFNIESLTRLSKEILTTVETYPATYSGKHFVIRAEGVGQAIGYKYVVDHDEGIAAAVGCDDATMVRFQICDPDGLYLYRIHASGHLASRLCELTGGTLSLGIVKNTLLTGCDLIVECRGSYREIATGFVDKPNQRERAVLWRLVGIQNEKDKARIA